uniref:Uncharacterized protein n=1 Tax=Triticum urartu TaxID=4572 RepID=A0A8R7PVU2_TRIUA
MASLCPCACDAVWNQGQLFTDPPSSYSVQTLIEDLQLARGWLVVRAARACSPLLVPPSLQVLHLLRRPPWYSTHGQSMPQPTTPAGVKECLQDWHMYFRQGDSA